MFRRISCAVLALAAGPWCAAEIVDAVAATVGNEVILRSDVADEVAPLAAQIEAAAASQAQAEAEYARVLRGALDQAIEFKLLYRQAQLAGMQIEDDLVEQRVSELRKRFGTDAEFQDMLERSGETLSELRDRMRQQILAISMGQQKRRELERDVAISSAEVEQYYRDHPGEFARKERVLLRRIFLPAETPGDRAKSRAQLEALRGELELGANFGELARRYSKGPEAETGGRVGWVQRGDLVAGLEDAAFALEAGGVGAPVETEYGVVLLAVEQREPAGQATLDEVRIEIEPKLRAERAEVRYREWMDDLRGRSRVRVFL